MATKSTPDGVDLKLSNYSTTAAMNGSIASANNATLATVAANYGLKTVVDQHSLDIAARITPLEVDTKVANALLGAVTAAALASELASRDASISGLQASKADASALTAYALQSAVDTSSEVDSKIAAALLDAVTTTAVDAAFLGKADASALASLLSTVDGLDTPLEVDTKIANALLGLATEVFVAAQLASRDASITALQASKADATLLASYATNAALSASKTALQSALDAILAELAALQLSGSGVVNAPAWAGFTTWELVRGSSVVRNLHLGAPLSAALANGDDTLSITADCYSTAGTDAAITAALLAYYTSSQVDTLLGDYRTGTAQDAETAGAITAALLAYTSGRAVGRLPHGERAGHADAGGHRGRAAGLPDGPGPGRVHHQPNHLGAGGVPFGRGPGDGLLANKLGVTEAASALQIAVRFPDDGGAAFFDFWPCSFLPDATFTGNLLVQFPHVCLDSTLDHLLVPMKIFDAGGHSLDDNATLQVSSALFMDFPWQSGDFGLLTCATQMCRQPGRIFQLDQPRSCLSRFFSIRDPGVMIDLFGGFGGWKMGLSMLRHCAKAKLPPLLCSVEIDSDVASCSASTFQMPAISETTFALLLCIVSHCIRSWWWCNGTFSVQC